MQSPDNSIEAALTFARETASHELNRIDTLHKRTLIGLNVSAGAWLLVIGVLGWVGYRNLRDLAIAAAQKQMHEEVKRQVADKIAPVEIKRVVRDILKEKTDAELQQLVTNQVGTKVKTEVAQQVREQFASELPQIRQIVSDETKQAVSGLGPTIRTTAIDETKRIVQSSFPVLGLVGERQQRLKSILRSKGHHSVTFRCEKLDSFQQDIIYLRDFFAAAGWSVGQDINMNVPLKYEKGGGGVETVIVGPDSKENPDTKALLDSLDEAGIKYSIATEEPAENRQPGSHSLYPIIIARHEIVFGS